MCVSLCGELQCLYCLLCIYCTIPLRWPLHGNVKYQRHTRSHFRGRSAVHGTHARAHIELILTAGSLTAALLCSVFVADGAWLAGCLESSTSQRKMLPESDTASSVLPSALNATCRMQVVDWEFVNRVGCRGGTSSVGHKNTDPRNEPTARRR